jgi:Mor family transcriptional regulator
MKKTCVIKFRKVNNKLAPKDGLMKARLKEFIESLTDDDEIECIIEAMEPNNTKAQLAKIHVMIKEISDETGEDVKKTKKDIKDQCGLTAYIDGKKVYKSFGSESKESLSDVIEKIYLIGDFLNINFRKDLQ